jgi:hypothetical protein
MTPQRSRKFVACTSFALITLAAASVMAQPAATVAAAAPAASRCVVNVTSPMPGEGVGKEGSVVGTAQVPPGSYVHVLAHRKDYVAEWWPQMSRAAVLTGAKGDFIMIAGYGVEKDVNSAFEIAVVVVGEDDHKRLSAYEGDVRRIALERKLPPEWTPVPLPATVEGCAPVMVTVKKTSHQ